MTRTDRRALRAGVLAAGWLLTILPGVVRAQFADISTTPMGLAETSFGVAWADVEGDGDADLFVTMYNAAQPNRLYRNDGTETFPEVSPAALDLVSTSIAGSAWGDYDADGDLDVFLNASGTGTCVLMRNEGTGWINRATGAMSTADDGRGATWVDFDGDGDLDLHRVGNTLSRMFRNDGTSFVESTPTPLGTAAQTAAWCDYNADGFPDMVSAKNGFAPVLARNNGNGTFTNVATGALAAVAQCVSSNWVDYDNDGDFDLFLPTYSGGVSRLFRNDGGDVFTSVSAGFLTTDPALNAVASAWADYDNDGDQDVWLGGLSGTPGCRLGRNDGSVFSDQGGLAGVTVSGYYPAAGWADFDQDGDVDLMVGAVDTPDHLYRNDLATGLRWLEVDLVGWVSPTAGTGSRVEVTAGGRTQLRQVTAGVDGWTSHGPATAHFGLGGATTVNSVVVRWPSGRTSTLNNVAVDQRITVYEPGGIDPPDSYTPGAAFDFRVDPGDAPITAMNLRYRAAGSTGAFTTEAMALNGSVFERSISSSSAATHGIEYVIEYRRGGGTGELFPKEGASAPAFLPAVVASRTWTLSPAAEAYALFGVPFVPSSGGAVTSVLDELGAEDKKKWRLGRWDPGTGSGSYREHPGTETFAPGRGFWLVQKSPVPIAAGGLTTSTVGGFPIQLRPGWNQIANPYLFPMPLAGIDFTGAPNVEARLVRYDGSGYSDVASLAPWEGAWMRNNAAVPQTIVISGATSSPASPPPAPRSAVPVAAGWTLRVDLVQGSAADRGNVIGETPDATDGVDALDFHAPPAFPGQPRVSLRAFDAGSTPHELDVDLRRSSAAGSRWDLVVELPANAPATLSFDGLADLPGNRRAVLLVEDTFATVDLADGEALSLPGARTHRFRLVIGDPAFVEAAARGEDSVPEGVALGIAYPNPFTGETRIGFALPFAAPVALDVFDVQGRRVRSLAAGSRGAGRHVATWDGRDEAGRRVGAGVYWVRLTAGAEHRSQRVVRLD